MRLSSIPKGVRKWGRGLYIYKGDDREVTHLCLDGGKLHISPEREDWLHVKLGVDHARNVRNFIVERRTEIFKFHADIDLFEPIVRDISDVLVWIRDDMLEVLRQFYPQFEVNNFKELLVLVSTTEPKKNVKKYGRMYDKVGVHLIFPWLLITKELSMILRSAFIQYFKAKYGDRDIDGGYNEWADVFDKTVYCGNGLRMLGCAKTEKCKECKNKKGEKEDCETCDGIGKLDIGRIYRICNVINGDGSDNIELMTELSDDEIEMVRISSIRTTETVNNVSCLFYPSWFDPKIQFDVTVKTTNTSKGVGGGSRVRISREDRIQLKNDDIRLKKIVEWFGNNDLHELFRVPSEYRKCTINDVTMCTPVNEGIFSRYYLVQIDSTYCMNLGSEHSSSGIYFVITSNGGLYQKCFCRCNTLEGRKSGKRCEEFKSDIVEIPDDLDYLLFPYEEDNWRNEYCGFMAECNNSLSSIKDERTLLDRLLSDALSN